jgi:nicotinamide-nucleotide amidase
MKRIQPARRARRREAIVMIGMICWLASESNGHSEEIEAAMQDPLSVSYTIIVTGSELLSGVYSDGHTYYLTRTLRPLGLRCVRSISVDDRVADIKQALHFARSSSKFIILTGGLGPTESDVTREALSEYSGIALGEDSELVKQMELRFGVGQDQLRANLRRQTRVPVRGTYLPNANGTAVGLVFELDDLTIVALPGPPNELQAMVESELVPYLARRFGTRAIGASITLRFVGLGQSQIDAVMKERMRLPVEVVQSTQFRNGRVDFTFSLPHDSTQDRVRLEQLRSELHQHLGQYVYADDPKTTLEEAVARKMIRSQQKIGLAEIGTGGLLATGLTESPDAADVLAGALVAASEEQLRKILEIADEPWKAASKTERIALLMRGTAERMRSDWTIVVGQPQHESAGTAIRMAFALRDPEGVIHTQDVGWRGSAASERMRLATLVLDQLRRICTHQESVERH